MKKTLRLCDQKTCQRPATRHILEVEHEQWVLDLCPDHSPLEQFKERGLHPGIPPTRRSIDKVTRPWLPN